MNNRRRDLLARGLEKTGSAFLKSETSDLPINISTSPVQEGKMRTGKSTRVVIGLIVALAFVFSAIGLPDASAATKAKFDITVTQPDSGSGSITPKGKSGIVKVTEGKNSIFTLKPATDYHLATVTIDGAAIELTDSNLKKVGTSKVYKYTFPTVSAAHTIAATFEADETFTLTVTPSGIGKVTSSTGIKCGGTLTTCSKDVKEGKSVILIAVPSLGGSVSWTGCTVDSKNSKKCTFTMSADTEVTADFTAQAGSSSAKAKALKILEKVSVVEAKAEAAQVSPMKIARSVSRAAVSDLSATSDYNKDQTFTFVNERSIEVFDTVNEILCMMSQAKYDEMLNKGNYIAQIDKSQCSNDKDSAESAGQDSQDQTSGSDAVSYMQWTVNSSRENDTAPQIVKAWLHEEGDKGMPAVIYTQTTIKAGVSEENPYGDFEMHFKFYPLNDDGTINDSPAGGEKGFIKTVKTANGKVALTFASDGDHGDFSFQQRAVLKREKDGVGGTGKLSSRETGPEGENETLFDIAFNEAYFYRDGFGEEPLCLDRNTFEETAWRYGMYNAADGSRVNRNSGFPVKFHDDTKDRDYHGYVGYGGLWFPNDIQIQSGQIVKKFIYTPGQKPTEEEYEVVISNGKLKKHVRKLLTLEDIKNIPLQYHEQSQTQGPGPGVEYRVIWDGTSFKKVAKMEMTQDGPPIWTDLTTAATMNVTENVNMPELNFWSQSLGGQVRVKLDCQMPKFETFGMQMPSYTCKDKTTATVIDMGQACANRDKSDCFNQANEKVELEMICGNQFGGDMKCEETATHAYRTRDEACMNKATSACFDPSGLKTIPLDTICNSQAPGGGLTCKDTTTGSIIMLDQACNQKTISECRDKSNLVMKLDDVCANKLPMGMMCKNTTNSTIIMFDQACANKSTSACTNPDNSTLDLYTACNQQPGSGMSCKNTVTLMPIPREDACKDKASSSCTDASGMTQNLDTLCSMQEPGSGPTCKNKTTLASMTQDEACKNQSAAMCVDAQNIPMDLMTICGGGGLVCKNTTTNAQISKDVACQNKTTSTCSDPMNPAFDLNMLCGGGMICSNITTQASLSKEEACLAKTTSECKDPSGAMLDLNSVCGTQQQPTTHTKLCKQNNVDVDPMTACQSIVPGTQPTFTCTDNGVTVMDYQQFCMMVMGGSQPHMQAEGQAQMMPTFTCNAPNDNTSVIFYSENMVYPSDTVPAKLRCYDNCPKVENGVVSTQMMNFDPSKLMETTFSDYTFDSTAMVIKDKNSNPVVQTSTSFDPNNPGAQFGAMSGPMFDPDDADNMVALKCGDMMMDDSSKNGICPWKAWSELDVFYTWETGNNNWNKFTALKKNGAFLTFDPPLQVQYTHSQAGNKYDGSKFYLEYAGFGELQGIPGTCIDFNTGEKIACGPNTRWIPEFSIPSGSEVTDGSDASKKYYVKALEREQRMKKVENSVCEAAGLEFEEWPLPTMNDWKDPKIGTEPIIIGAPAVVGGVVQSSTTQN